ncbi:MAG: hypothetical protein SFW66_05730 [Gammaproteobacteria bacterium]|nr:hypothetical protein [Gammaproteobacteria bacterium]
MRHIIKKTLLATAISACLSSAAFATQINLTVGNDLVAANDTLNLSYDIFAGSGFHSGSADIQEEQNSMEGFQLAHVAEYMNMLNEDFQSKTIVDQPELGHVSTFTLGYKKGDKNIYPANCKINLAGKNVINVTINEAGCIVS